MENCKLKQEVGDDLSVSYLPVVSILSTLVIIGLVKVNFKFWKLPHDLEGFLIKVYVTL